MGLAANTVGDTRGEHPTQTATASCAHDNQAAILILGNAEDLVDRITPVQVVLHRQRQVFRPQCVQLFPQDLFDDVRRLFLSAGLWLHVQDD
jgi:hypothetical protein